MTKNNKKENKSDRKIVWEKWTNPALFSIKDFKHITSLLNGDMFRDNDGNLQTLTSLESEEDDDRDEDQKVMLMHGMPVPVEGNSDIGKAFNIWIGHANFDLTPGIIAVIDAMPGVEILRPLSRYRFLVGFGKAFLVDNDTTEIRRNIVKTIENQTIPKEQAKPKDTEKPKNVKADLIAKATNKQYWLYYIFPNEKKIIISSNENDQAFQKEMDVYAEIHLRLGGELVTYLDK